MGRPNLGSKQGFLDRVDQIFEDRWLTNNGPLVQELEHRIASYLGVKHCIAVANGTLGLQLAAQALELDGNVVMPAMTFIATAHAFHWIGIQPKFADIDPKTLNLCPDSVAAQIDGNTSCIVGVHLFGRPCAVKPLETLAREHQIPLIFDASHSFGSSHNDQRIGTFGTCEVFSFHATKIFNTFEGGAITTNDADLAAKLKLVRNFGFDGEDSVTSLGINAKMSEINAAMGLTNLDAMPRFIETNTEWNHNKL